MLIWRLTARLRRAFPTITALAILAGSGALLAGCGASGALDPVAHAAEVSARQPGVNYTLQMRLSSRSASRTFAIAGTGYADGQDGRGWMRIDLSAVPGISSLAGGGSPEAKVMFAYPTLYMKMPFLTDRLPAGTSWMKLDVATLAKQLADGSVPEAFLLSQLEPTQFLQYLRASSGQVAKLESQQLYGIPTTRYRATIQLSRILQRLPAGERSPAKAMLQGAGEHGAVPVEVWIDSQDRVRQIQLTLRLSGATATGSAAVTLGYSHYGPVPAIATPPSGEVINLTSMLSSNSGSGND